MRRHRPQHASKAVESSGADYGRECDILSQGVEAGTDLLIITLCIVSSINLQMWALFRAHCFSAEHETDHGFPVPHLNGNNQYYLLSKLYSKTVVCPLLLRSVIPTPAGGRALQGSLSMRERSYIVTKIVLLISM